MTRRGSAAAAVLVALGGLMVAGAGVAGWVVAVDASTVGGVELSDVEATEGLVFAPLSLPLGLLGALLAVAVGILRGGARRAAAALALVVGVGAAVALVSGVIRAVGAEGSLTTAPAVAGFGVVVLGAGAVMALRRPRPPRLLGERYELDADDADDEWRMASDVPEDGWPTDGDR